MFLFTGIFSLIDYFSITAIKDVILLSLLVTPRGPSRPWVGSQASPAVILKGLGQSGGSYQSPSKPGSA